MSASLLLRATVYVSTLAIIALLFMSASGAASRRVVDVSAIMIMAVATVLALNIRCPRCGERAMMNEHGVSHLNRRCRRCGADLTTVRPRWRRL